MKHIMDILESISQTDPECYISDIINVLLCTGVRHEVRVALALTMCYYGEIHLPLAPPGQHTPTAFTFLTD